MILIVCVEDNLGMMFNCRRQSKDRILRERILEIAGEQKLFVSDYTAKQFAEKEQPRLTIFENAKSICQEEGYCWIENPQELPPVESISSIILYRWNRAYPSDQFFPVDLSNWEMTSSREFVGSSHEKITEEVYRKNENILEQ